MITPPMRRIVLALAIIAAPAAAQTAPELFAPGKISTRENELNAAFSPDGRTIYFTRKAGDAGRYAVILFSTALPGGGWSEPEVASFSGRYPDYDPIVSPDGGKLFFISKRPVTGLEPRTDLDMWEVERAGDGWGEPRHLGTPLNSNGDELYPSVAADGALYFSSCGRPDSKGRCDLYRARYQNGRYLEPENLGDGVNTPASETDAYVAPDQSYLVFTVYGRPDAVGDGDLYISTWRDGAWTAARSLGPGINTVAREYCPIVSPDGKYLYYTSQVGFFDGPTRFTPTYGELHAAMSGLRNGFGNIYRVPVSTLGDPWPPAAD